MRDSSIQSDTFTLDVIGIREATDKSSLVGDYLRQYDSLFADMRHDEFNLIEIGVFQGGSARTWERFFTRARIIGVDIDPQAVRKARTTLRQSFREYLGVEVPIERLRIQQGDTLRFPDLADLFRRPGLEDFLKIGGRSASQDPQFAEGG